MAREIQWLMSSSDDGRCPETDDQGTSTETTLFGKFCSLSLYWLPHTVEVTVEPVDQDLWIVAVVVALVVIIAIACRLTL